MKTLLALSFTQNKMHFINEITKNNFSHGNPFKICKRIFIEAIDYSFWIIQFP